MDLSAVGGSHPSVRHALALRRGTAGDRDRHLLVEGLWGHRVLLGTDVTVCAFFSCPEAACSEDAHSCAEQVAQRAQASYRISAKTLARLSERDRPDGLLSIVMLPSWSLTSLSPGADALLAVADGLETPATSAPCCARSTAAARTR